MKKFSSAVALTFLAAGAQAAPADVFDANKAAMGGAAWDGKETVTIDYAYSGQGMTGKVESRADLKSGAWTDNIVVGPASEANGFDGTHAWAKDPSGTVTLQDGGDQRQLAVNEAYRRANLWWRSDRAGAAIVDDGAKNEGGATTYDIVTVTPVGGKDFDAWFDRNTHLLTRVVEKQGPQTVTSTISGYAATDSVEIAQKILVNTGDVKYDQTETTTKVDFGPALPPSAYSAPKVMVADYAIAGGAKETTFPFKLINNHIYADVRVNGKGPYQFIFDSGGVNLVTPPLVAELGLKSEGQMEGNGAGSGHMDVGLTKVAALQLGDATVKDQIFAVMALNSMSNIEGVGMPGMIGYETFRRFVTRVDYGKGTITLIRPDAFDPKDAGEAIPVTFNGNTIEAKAIYDGIVGNYTIDTGSRASLTLSSPFAAKNHLNKYGKSIDAVTGWGVGGPTRSVALRGDALSIGDLTVQGPVVEIATDKGGAFADPSLAGNIGAGILKRYVVTLDYEHTTLYLKPVSEPVSDLDTFDRAGIWFNQSASGYAVVDVTKGAPADQAALKTGDEIVAVDGKPANTIPVYEIRKRLRDEAPGTVVTFTVKRGNATKDVAVTLRNLI